jgi:hypothetical protein
MQRLIASSSAVATYLVLALFVPRNGGDPTGAFLAAAVVGAVVSFLWPWVIEIYLARRAKARRDDRIDDEVQRQLAEERANRG